MRNTLAVALCLSLTLVGCKAKEAMDKAAIAEDLQERGTTDLMKEVANDEYEGPADGKLTDAQVKMYLKVREHEKKIAQVAKEEMKKHADEAKKEGEKSIAGMMDGFKALGSAADFLTADIRAAKDLGFNTQEYLWVKGQVMAASTAAMAEGFQKSMSANFDKAYEDAKKAYDSATDETTKKMYAEMLAGYDKTREEMKQQAEQDPAVTFNRELLKKYEHELTAFASEMSKYADPGKEGEAEKAVQEMQKQFDANTKQ
ncbi:MAG TPA: hypothetical protein VF618_09700 [Thermoanaerobaculia bacterium]